VRHSCPFALGIVLLSITLGCSFGGDDTATPSQDATFQVGGLYASKGDDGQWSVCKVLAVDDDAVHLRSYANRFPLVPRDLDPSTLTMGTLDPSSPGFPGAFGIGHMPVSKQGYLSENPVLIKVVPVREDELDGYRAYLDAMRHGR
jgi:hypothetical protein